MILSPKSAEKTKIEFDNLYEVSIMKNILAPHLGKLAYLGLSLRTKASGIAEAITLDRYPVTVNIPNHEVLEATGTIGARVRELRAFDPANSTIEANYKQTEFHAIQKNRSLLHDYAAQLAASQVALGQPRPPLMP